MKILKNFVVFEGGDGSGTTTQLGLLEEFFIQNREKLSLPLLHRTCEPTDSPVGALIRRALREQLQLKAETIAFLFAADRNEHLFGTEGIAERCARGELVVTDRYLPSSLVYQGITCGNELPLTLNKDFPSPELLIFFDIDPEIAQKRMENRKIREIFENLDFQIQVRTRYKALLPALVDQGMRVETIDALRPPEEIAAEVRELIQNLPIIKQ